MLHADLNSLKVEIVKQILESSDSEILSSFNELLRNHGEFTAGFKLSSDVLDEIAISRKQIKEHKTVDWNDLRSHLK